MGLSNSKSVEQHSYDDPDTENIMKILSEVDGISNISKEYVEILKQNIYELERENEILRNNAEKYKKMYYDKIEEIREIVEFMDDVDNVNVNNFNNNENKISTKTF